MTNWDAINLAMTLVVVGLLILWAHCDQRRARPETRPADAGEHVNQRDDDGEYVNRDPRKSPQAVYSRIARRGGDKGGWFLGPMR